jgi:PBP1b-binding outer membrane lipoprotein LpoB
MDKIGSLLLGLFFLESCSVDEIDIDDNSKDKTATNTNTQKLDK